VRYETAATTQDTPAEYIEKSQRRLARIKAANSRIKKARIIEEIDNRTN